MVMNKITISMSKQCLSWQFAVRGDIMRLEYWPRVYKTTTVLLNIKVTVGQQNLVYFSFNQIGRESNANIEYGSSFFLTVNCHKTKPKLVFKE